ERPVALVGLAGLGGSKIVVRDEVSGLLEQIRGMRPQKSARPVDNRLARTPAAKSERNRSRRHSFEDRHAQVLLARRMTSGKIAVAGGVPVESRPAIKFTQVGLGKPEMQMHVWVGRPSDQSLRVVPVAALAANSADEMHFPRRVDFPLQAMKGFEQQVLVLEVIGS